MADYDMNMSSEVVHIVGDDDIDIDIDILPGQNDEDYILEDAQSDGGHDIGNDDLMMDDENNSYQMDDVDVAQDEIMVNMYMEDAQPAERPESGSGNGGMNIGGEDLAISLLDVDETSMARVVDDYHSVDAPQNFEDPERRAENAIYANANLFAEIEAHSVNNSPPKYPPQENAGAPEVHDLHDQSSQEYSSPKSKFAQDGQEYKWGTVDSQPTAVGDEDYSDTRQEIDLLGGVTNPPFPVIVIYQDVEYSLIATSDSDDPDTYFLQDSVLTKAPLADLFTALRDVIHEDLAVDDKLCLSIDDLGLDISETCMSVHETTLLSLVKLYERLLENDGVGTSASIRVTLKIKPDFAKRFISLLAGAAEGNGLSSYVTYDENENHQDGGNYDYLEDNSQESKAIVEEDQHPSEVVKFAGAGEDESSDNLPVVDHEAEDVSSEKITTHSLDAVKPEDAATSVSSIKLEDEHGKYAPNTNSSAEEESSRPKADPHTPQRAGSANRATPDVDKDGDLIDYSDDDYEQEAANVKRHTVKRSIQHESEQMIEQSSVIAAIKGAVHHPSSLAFEEAAISEPPVDQSIAAQNGRGRSNSRENENDFGEQEFPSYEHVDQEYEDNQEFEAEKEVDASNLEEAKVPFDEPEQAQEAENVPASQKLEGASAVADIDDVNNSNIPNADEEDLEIDYELRDHDSGSAQLFHGQASDLNNEELHEGTSDEPKGIEDEISYEDDDFREFNQSDHTLVADESSYNSDDGGNEVESNVQELGDEINYDSDVPQDLSNPSENKALDVITHQQNGRAGKRQRGDAEDVTQLSPKQPKRARS